jgi:hypothetical protein
MLGASSHITTLMMGIEIVPEALVSTCNQLTQLCAREDFIEFYQTTQRYNPEDSHLIREIVIAPNQL